MGKKIKFLDDYIEVSYSIYVTLVEMAEREGISVEQLFEEITVWRLNQLTSDDWDMHMLLAGLGKKSGM